MTPSVGGCFVRHLDSSVHVLLESAVDGYDCGKDCPKRKEIEAFLRFLGVSSSLVIGP